MIENKDDTLALDFVISSISKLEYIDEVILYEYESLYRRIRTLAIRVGLDTMELDKERNKVMKIYGEL